MKVLVATRRTQGLRPDDYCSTIDGELVLAGAVIECSSTMIAVVVARALARPGKPRPHPQRAGELHSISAPASTSSPSMVQQ